jgi:hypothetical protein
MEAGEVCQIAAVGPDGAGRAAAAGQVCEELGDGVLGGGGGRLVRHGTPPSGLLVPAVTMNPAGPGSPRRCWRNGPSGAFYLR